MFLTLEEVTEYWRRATRPRDLAFSARRFAPRHFSPALLILLRLAWSLFLSKGPRGGEMDDSTEEAEEEEKEELDMYSWAAAARLALALALLLVRLPVVTMVRGV